MEEITTEQVGLYPNPAKDVVRVEGIQLISYLRGLKRRKIWKTYIKAKPIAALCRMAFKAEWAGKAHRTLPW
jgi:hypothetical protein